MAKFRSPKPKEKRYIFDFLQNRKDLEPAAVMFSRFPILDENFMPMPKGSAFGDINFEKLGKKDEKEIEKFMTVFSDHVYSNASKVDYEHFARECFDHFENFYSDGKEIKTVDDFLSLNIEMMTLIANDCYKYAQKRDEFSMGESEAL